MPDRPNIILIMTDQQRANLRKGQGYPLDTMPFLDTLCQQGLEFDLAYTPNPTCMPARSSLFTGRYSESHQVRTNYNAIDAKYSRDLLSVLHSAGYQTGLCGKNHSFHPDSDFDWACTCGHLGHEGNMTLQSNPEEQLADFLDQSQHLESPCPSPGGVEAQHPYRNVSDALQFIAQSDPAHPFFLWLSFAEPHNPYQVPSPYFDLFPPDSLPKLQSSPPDCLAKGPRYIWLRQQWEAVLGPDIDRRIARARSNYLGMLRLIDDQLRRFWQELRCRGLLDNTLLIFVSDHGDFAGEYGLIRKGADLPEVLTHIPMIWCGQAVKQYGHQQTAMVNLVDIFPTICDLLDLPIPFGVQGTSLKPLLEGKAVGPDQYATAYAESGYGGLYWNEADSLTLKEEGACTKTAADGRPLNFDCLNSWTQSGQVRMLRRGPYKLQIDMLGQGYLYDLEQDPAELVNHYADPAWLPIVAAMQKDLLAVMLKNQDALPPPRARYRYKSDQTGGCC